MLTPAFLSPASNVAVLRALKNWPLYYVDYLGVAPGETHMFRFRDGLKLLFRNDRKGLTDRSTVKHVIMMDYYGVTDKTFRPDAVFVDVGAHIGSFSLMMAYRHPRARVIALEPTEASRRLLERNVTLNALQNVTISGHPVAGESRTVTLNVYDDLTGVSMFQQGTACVVDRQVTQAVTLEEVFARERIDICDYLKLDCEGAEFEIILGASDALLRRIRFVGMEYHDSLTPRTHRDLQARLEQAGFEVECRPRNAFLLGINWAQAS